MRGGQSELRGSGATFPLLIYAEGSFEGGTQCDNFGICGSTLSFKQFHATVGSRRRPDDRPVSAGRHQYGDLAL